MEALTSGVIAAAVGGLVGGVLSPICSAYFAERAAGKTRAREADLFRWNRVVQLFDDLNRLFYLARTETVYLGDALEQLEQSQLVPGKMMDRMFNPHRENVELDRFNEKRSAIVDRALSNLKLVEAQARADLAQLRELLPAKDYVDVADVLSQLAEPHDYTIESCQKRIALYDELEAAFTLVRTSAMTRVQSGLLE